MTRFTAFLLLLSCRMRAVASEYGGILAERLGW